MSAAHEQGDSGSFSEKGSKNSPTEDIEMGADDAKGNQLTREKSISSLKLDAYGLPLIPQPTNNKDDPLNYPQWLKLVILFQASILAMLGPFNHAIVNSAYVPVKIAFGLPSVSVASYQTVTALAMAGVAPLFWTPLANVYGRRPIYLISTIISIAAAAGSGKAKTYGTLICARLFVGMGTSAAMALGAGTVSDLFFLHERGRAMGFFVVCVTQGAHLAALLGGFIAQYSSYHWCFYTASIANGCMFLIMLFCLPETLYARPDEKNPHIALAPEQPLSSRMRLWGFRPEGRHLKIIDFFRPFQMAMYPGVLFTAVYYAIQFSYASIEPAVTVASLFTQIYHFKPGRIGLCLGLSTLIGASLGELLSGPIIDRAMRVARKKAGGVPQPEARLQAIWPGVVLLPAGLLTFGYCIHHRTSYVWPCIGMALANLGVQIISTVCYTYTSDSYKPQTGEISTLFNFCRQSFGFTLGFYSLPFGERIGFQHSFLVFAMIGLAFFIPILVLMWRGKELRERFGTPKFNKSF